MAEGTIFVPQPPLHDSTRSARRSPEVDFGRFSLSARRIDAIVAAISLIVFGWRFWAPSPWRDEAVTVDVTHRTWDQLAHLVNHVDLVHAAHYVLMKALFGASPGLSQMRFVSVLAAVATAVLLVRLGSALASPLFGIATAGTFVALPLASRYAQEARSYAIVTMLVTAATLALVHAVRAGPHPRPGLSWWTRYAALIVAAAVFHIFSLMILLPHAVYVLAQARGSVLERWLHSSFAAAVTMVPFAALAFSQREQVSWIPPTQNEALWLFTRDTFATTAFVVLLGLAVGYLAWRRRITVIHVFALSWVFAPALLLWAVSSHEPLFVLRYLAFTLPGAALAIASVALSIGEDLADRLALRRGLDAAPASSWRRSARARRVAVAVAVLGTALAGLSMQFSIRGTGLGHTENVRGAVDFVNRVALPGDAILFLPYDLRGLAQAYPEAFAELDDVALQRGAIDTSSLFGVDARNEVLESRLDHQDRVVVLMRPQTGANDKPTRSDATKLEILRERFFQTSEMDAWPFRIMVFDHLP